MLATERRQSVEREATAESGRAAALAETERVNKAAEAARLQAQADSVRLTQEKNAAAAAAASEADRLKRENETRSAAAASEADRLKRENETQAAAAAVAADRLKLEADAKMAAAKLEADRLKLDADARAAAGAAETERLKRENDAQRTAAQAELDRAAQQNAKLEAEKVELRNKLFQQFNAILQTRDTARGLIVNMSDVLFDTGKATLRPLAREKLAKVAGIVSGHPSLRLDVEGFTDSVGTDEYNQKLSERRGMAVQDYLTGAGMAAASVSSKGFGETMPVASNDSAQGRQQNRRVELVISGEVIGKVIGVPTAR